uniref:AVL9 homolog (S. cerevisiase) n=1 Tax=Eptatretus burgeri TaxID=7764 RepID=A0A8C4QIL8_EPTBU
DTLFTFQVEFSYPPLVPGESHDSKKLPEEWKYLPFLALPDGAHNYQEDVIYFLLPARQGEKKCVYAVSCYKQIEAKGALKVREADVRELPFFGLLQAKLKLITHAYFEEKDFSQISILKVCFMHPLLTFIILFFIRLVLLPFCTEYFDHILERHFLFWFLFSCGILSVFNVLFIGSPVEKLVSPMMSLLSLFPGIIEYGLAKASGYRPRLSVSTNSRQCSTDNTSSPVPVTNGSNESPGSEASVSSSDGRTDSAELLQPPGSGGTGRLRISLASSESDWETLEPGMLEIESAGGTTGPPTPEGALEDDAVDVETDVVKQEEEVNRSVEMLSGLEENDHGMPLAIFTKGYLFMPYMALQQHHLLADVSIRGFLAGATNIIFRQQRHLSDVIVDVATAQLEVQDPELRRILELSTADLRFTDWLLRHVSEPASEDLFLNGTDWEGGDEWVRAQFALYMDSLLTSTLQPDNERIIADFGIGFVSMWQNTHNYRVWNGREHPGMAEVTEGFILSCLQLSYPSSHSWYSESCGEAVALKQFSFSFWKANLTEGNLRSFHKARNECASSFRRARKHLFDLKNELSNLSPSSKTQRHLVKSVSGVCSSSIPFLTSNGSTANSAREKAECLNSVFASKSCPPNLPSLYPSFPVKPNCS